MQRATDRSSRRETAGIQLNSRQPRPAPESPHAARSKASGSGVPSTA